MTERTGLSKRARPTTGVVEPTLRSHPIGSHLVFDMSRRVYHVPANVAKEAKARLDRIYNEVYSALWKPSEVNTTKEVGNDKVKL